MVEEEVLLVPGPIRIKLSNLDKLLRTLGHETARDQARFLGVDESSWSRLRNGQRGVSVELIAAVMRALPKYEFADFFEAVANIESGAA